MKRGIIPAAVMTVLCVISCISFLILSGVLDEEDGLEYELSRGEGSVSYEGYTESYEVVNRFVFELDDYTKFEIVVFTKDGVPRGYSYEGRTVVGGSDADTYSSDGTTVYIVDGRIVRIDAPCGDGRVCADLVGKA